MPPKDKGVFGLRTGACEMVFTDGPENVFRFSTQSPKIQLDRNILSRKRVRRGRDEPDQFIARTYTMPRLDPAPTIMCDENTGDVRIRESYRVIDNRGQAIDPAQYAARVIHLKSGHFVFKKPFRGPEERNLTMCFYRPEDTVWDQPMLVTEGLVNDQASKLALSQSLKHWSKVRELTVVLKDGMDCEMLQMPRVLTCCQMAEKSMKALSSALVSRYHGALDAEEKEKEKQLVALARRNVSAKVKKDERWPERMVLVFSPLLPQGQPWLLEKDQILDLSAG